MASGPGESGGLLGPVEGTDSAEAPSGGRFGFSARSTHIGQNFGPLCHGGGKFRAEFFETCDPTQVESYAFCV